VGLADLIQRFGGNRCIFYGAPATSKRTFLSELLADPSPKTGQRAFLLIVGPEGGLTDAEERQIEAAGGTGVALAPTILRIETAAVGAAAVWACWMGIEQ
jgi:RsmE family RNA methyltransferase